MLPFLNVSHVYKSFRPGSYAVNDISFSLSRGECLGIAGESGSGKSTLIRMIGRLINVSADPENREDSYIRLFGRDISLFSPKLFARHDLRSQIQMVFQDPTSSLNPSWTVARSIADPLRMLFNIRDEALLDMHARRLAELVHLSSDLLDRLPHQLSGGQKARVGIARALAPRPSIILLDEPTTALDVSVQGRILCLLDDLKKSMGISYIFVSHDLSVLRLLCDRLLVMRYGRIVEEGTSEEIFAHPKDDYTRRLLSSAPLLSNY